LEDIVLLNSRSIRTGEKRDSYIYDFENPLDKRSFFIYASIPLAFAAGDIIAGTHWVPTPDAI
jgi:hypothetical protein